ncbi:Na(+)/H(+) antiporter [Penicillium riverlandense]|uniref:Na(+)/H(+) antiporter n=1 Tax=Penicillium riverlandense TaxID=1903569 RepID=UPI002549307C|nr:Na(+)/H(+) antiporter [Penicillium riverlandense]KAJ5811413.1 Na(+)/H(+) antiporter [Penicillium riverlandense]
MAWDHLDIDKPHLAYMILGGFTGLFMLCSLFVKEKLYIGEATVATICGIIFGPSAANLFNPREWGNVDKITLECSRIVLVVQCFAVGVELPKAYMERHWKSVVLLLVPVMTWGWLMTSLFIWWLVPPLNWLESLVCAACVTATDPVLASSVVGKGKFAKRVPKHLRDVLSAESGCNDGMAFPFIYLAFYILRYRPDAGEVSLNWFCVTILYECIFGAVYGFLIGYGARHAIKLAERKGLIDRESFLVFYFVLAVFCAGSGSLLGMDDLLIGFSCGVGFSNDGWFTEKTEESHVSNVIDLLLNLAYFVYFGSIIPWGDYNSPEIGLVPWRLVVIAILVIFFRRIPIMLLLKPIIPDVKTWREALFAGHFGPIGVGAIFAAILARAELENDSTNPLPQSELPKAGTKNYYIIQLIWPITTFMVISSILVHGSSIAVFTLGKRINTLTITLSYTQANEEGPSWMNRLPRVQSLAKGSMSFRKPDELDAPSDEKLPEYAPGTLPPIGMPGNFLRRVRDDDSEVQSTQSPNRTSLKRRRRSKRHADAGGPISQSAIAPVTRLETESDEEKNELEDRDHVERGTSPPTAERDRYGREPGIEVYQEGHKMVIEDEEGNVLKTEDTSHLSPEEQKQHIEEQRTRLMKDTSGKFAPSRSQPHEKTEGEEIQHAVNESAGQPYQKLKKWTNWTSLGKGRAKETEEGPSQKPEPAPKQKARSAHAYQFGNTIIVEDEDGEVLKKYTIPGSERDKTKPKPKPKPEAEAGPSSQAQLRRGLNRMGTWLGREEEGEASQAWRGQKKKAAPRTDTEDWALDDGLRFTVAQNQDISAQGVGIGHAGRRMNKQEFFEQLRGMDARARRDLVQQTDAPAPVQQVAQHEANKEEKQERRLSMAGAATSSAASGAIPEAGDESLSTESVTGSEVSDEDSENRGNAPSPSVAASLARFTRGTSAQERRSNLSPAPPARVRSRRDSDDDGTERVPPSRLRQAAGLSAPPRQADDDTGETPAERRRRLAALGEIGNDSASDSDAAIEDSDSEDNGEPRRVPSNKVQFADEVQPGSRPSPGADQSSASGSGSGSQSTSRHRPRISWGGEMGRDS